MLDVLAEGAGHAEAFGIGPHGWVAIAMLVVIGIAIRAGVPRIIAGVLDSRIAEIREQLAQARKLREEAEQLREQYVKRLAGADQEIAEMMANAKAEGEAILKKAEADSKALVERHKRMAEDKIAAAQRDALEEVRRTAAQAATSAAEKIIAQKSDEKLDAKIADELIESL